MKQLVLLWEIKRGEGSEYMANANKKSCANDSLIHVIVKASHIMVGGGKCDSTSITN